MKTLITLFKLLLALSIFLLFTSMSGCKKDEDEDKCILTKWDEEVRYKIRPRLKFYITGEINIREADTMYIEVIFNKWDCGITAPDNSELYITDYRWLHPKLMTDEEFYKEFYLPSEYFYFDNDLDYVTFSIQFSVTIGAEKWHCPPTARRYGFPSEFEDWDQEDPTSRGEVKYATFDVYYDVAGLNLYQISP